MKILVTGGAGFIGSHIVDAYIDAGHAVIVIDNLSTGSKKNINKNAKFFELDIRSSEAKEIILKEKPEVINHHAAQIDVRRSVDDPKFDVDVNVCGLINILFAAKDVGVKKVVFASSGGAIYGEDGALPATEKNALDPVSPYGINKLAGEKYLNYYKREHGIDYVALRYANVYGPRQNHKGEAGVVAIFINKMLGGGEPVINGDGRQTRDYVYVEDVVKANLAALKNEASGVYNVGTGIETSVVDIFTMLKNATRSNSPQKHVEAKKGEQLRSVISSAKIRSELGCDISTELKYGIKTTVEFFKGQKIKPYALNPISYALIMAGGEGTRFAPISTPERPKQFLSFIGDKSFIRQTFDRIVTHVKPENIYVSTNARYVDLVKEELPEVLAQNIIGEPSKKNTCPAIAYAIKLIEERHGKDSIVVVLPSDHHIEEADRFVDVLCKGIELAKDGYHVTFGMKPQYPSTEYGYISPKSIGEWSEVDSFREKPSADLAADYIQRGYLWNGGIFILNSTSFLQDLAENSPEMHNGLEDFVEGREFCDKFFSNVQSISIDYAIMERSKKVAVIPCDIGWSDVGSWDSVKRLAGNGVLLSAELRGFLL